MRRATAILLSLVVLSGCGAGDDGEPVRLNGDDSEVVALIQERYGDCMDELGIPKVRWTVNNLYSGNSPYAANGGLTFSAWSVDDEILTTPTAESAVTLESVDCG